MVIENGKRLRSPGLYCEVTLSLHNSQFLVDFYLIELEGYDAVLGAQWLRTLGPIVWNFDTMEMGFTAGNEEIWLVGIGQSEPRLVCTWTVNKALKNGSGRGMLLKIRLVDEGEGKET